MECNDEQEGYYKLKHISGQNILCCELFVLIYFQDKVTSILKFYVNVMDNLFIIKTIIRN